MKVDSKASPRPGTTTAARPFQRLLAEARGEPRAPARPVVRPPRPVPPGLAATGTPAARAAAKAHAATTTQLSRARAHANAEAGRLDSGRAEAHEGSRRAQLGRGEQLTQHRATTTDRILEIIGREFSPEAAPPGAPTRVLAHVQPPAPPPPHVAPEPPHQAKAAQATALIERIELFVRSQRPGLALTLNNSLGAHVEISRVGPREVALRLVGHQGPPTPEAVSRIREALRARGLKVSALEVA
jgi:hypothetical protein